MSRKTVTRITLAATIAVVGMLGALAFVSHTSAPRVANAAQEIDPSYANDTTVYMIGPHTILNASPQLMATSAELYITAYPINPTGATNLGPLTLPGGYQPLCDPCFHPGLPKPFGYHDHVLSGAPGFGTNGTAGSFKGPWKIIVMLYNPASFSCTTPGCFQPVKSDEELDTAEAHGEFLPINGDLAHGSNPYELVTGNVLICPLVSSHA